MTESGEDPGLVASLRGLDGNGRLLFLMRTVRMFGYGFLAVVLVLYLAAAGLDPLTIGIVLTLTLLGDAILSLWLTTNADRLGRRRVLVAGAGLMVAAGVVFAFTSWVPLLILAGALGVISPTGNEVGPFLAVEQAALAQTVSARRRTATFAWYNLVGYVATATGALGAGLVSQALLDGGLAAVDAYRAVVVGYALIGGRAGPSGSGGWAPPSRRRRTPTEADGIRRRFGLGRSRGVVLRLSALFSLDAFAGGFIPQSLMAYWFHLQFGRRAGGPRRDLLRGKPARGGLVAVGGPDRGALRAHQHDGVHPPALERAPAARAAHADAAAGGSGPAPPLHAQPDGRADTPVVRHGGGRAR